MIIFRNKGVIDIRAIKTFGMSVKENDNAIGYFGTGLKYAIAIFLRNNFKVTLYAGLDKYEFGVSNVNSRGKDFSIITMNNEELPFTTHLGANWELWQAFRELHCNATDEGGDSFYENSFDPDENSTTFVVEGPDDIGLFAQKPNIILTELGRIDLSEAEYIDSFSNSIFYKGIKVLSLNDQSLFTWNIKSPLILTEDRTLRSGDRSDQISIVRSIATSKDKYFIKNCVCAPKGSYESKLSYGSIARYMYPSASDEFIEVCRTEYKANNDLLNSSLREWMGELENNHRHKNIKIHTLDKREREMMSAAMKVVRSFYRDADEKIITVTESLGNNTFAFYDPKEDKIYMSRDCFDQGLLFLTSTILEEMVHKKTGLEDESRGLQTFLFDSLSKNLAKEVGVLL